ncbi:hypothetical protein ACER0A_001320 [Haloimpatiens sp. FM7315]|uniref:hypothetical protein n=1 Tax=Haloimpatiens sp. FM7315 TaxID=3298609 RepID=UPI0035A2CF77
MDTLKFTIVTGTNEGYFHSNENSMDLNYLGELIQRISKDIYKKNGVYLSAVINVSKTIYKVELGCPKSGEDTINITGIASREYARDLDLWKESVLEFAKELKAKLKQNSITCEFNKIELYYLKGISE